MGGSVGEELKQEIKLQEEILSSSTVADICTIYLKGDVQLENAEIKGNPSADLDVFLHLTIIYFEFFFKLRKIF